MALNAGARRPGLSLSGSSSRSTLGRRCRWQLRSTLAYNGKMEPLAKGEPVERGEGFDKKQPLVFLDTNVIVGYLRGEPSAAQLFSAEAEGRIRFAVNPIVLQELLLAADATSRPEFERIRDHLRVLPVDFAKAEALLPRVRALRNRLAHSNDILILSSAVECDFLVTRDASLKTFLTAEKPQVVTPEELVTHLRAA
jgi:predicted nucleic acid-binding protein